MAGNTKVSSYKRTTSSGQVVDVGSYSQDRDLGTELMAKPGRPGMAGKPGSYGRGRQVPGQHDRPINPSEPESAEARVQAAIGSIDKLQAGLGELKDHLSALMKTEQDNDFPEAEGEGDEQSPSVLEKQRGQKKGSSQEPSKGSDDKSQFEGADATAPTTPPLNDAEYEEYQKEIQYKVDQAIADGQETNKLHTVDAENEVWTKERAAMHDQMLSEIIEAHEHVPRDKKAVMAGGLGGSGKTTVLSKHAGISDAEFLALNPDDLKEELVKRGMGPQIEGLSPMEASMLLHEESSYLSKMLAQRAYDQNMNVKWDITMSSKGSTEKKLEELAKEGYEVEAVFVDIPVEESVNRALSRHRRGLEKHRNGEGLGGRYVPPKIIRKASDSEFSSGNRRTMEELKDRFIGFRVFDNSVYGRDPMLMAEGGTIRSREAQRREAVQEHFTKTTEKSQEQANPQGQTTALSAAVSQLRSVVS